MKCPRALFIQFVPNYTQDISKVAPWAIYGIFLIVFIYAMPRGNSGALRALRGRVLRSTAGPVPGETTTPAITEHPPC